MSNVTQLLSVFILFLWVQNLVSQSTITDRIRHNGRDRDFRLYIPSSYENSQQPLALVINMHGFTSTAAQQELSSEMNNIAEKDNFLVCYPNGINRSWNVGWAFGSTADDVGFISELIDYIGEKYDLDKSRVYACGMSNGGFMAFRLACELSDKIAAVASVTGSMIPEAISACEPNKAVPVLQIHGTQDFVVNYNGSNIAAPIDDVLNLWIENNKCPEEPIITELPDINTTDNTTTEIIKYGPCDNQTEVLHYKIQNGSHTWPRLNATAAGTSRDFDASQVIWDFFSKFSLGIESTTIVSSQKSNRIFPNPFSEFIYFESESDIEIIIIDAMGQALHRQKYPEGTHSIATTHLKKGFYTVMTVQNGISKYFKLIKPL